jgi:polyhydroxybutyrate depolymerase
MSHMSRAGAAGVVLLAVLVPACAPLETSSARVSPASAWASGGSRPGGSAWTSADDQGRTSPGCGSGGSVVPESILVRGRERSFIARVPASYSADEPHDLVVAFHGRTNANTQVREYFGLDEALPDAIILYPSALPETGGFRWSDPGDLPAELRDYALLDALLVAFGTALCVDLERLFVVGHSLGASFANSVACHRGAVVRAVASVAGGIEGHDCDGGVATLVIHHPEDQLVPIAEGIRSRDAFLEANGLRGQPVPASEPELVALGCQRYGPDSPDPVIWCVHDDATGYGGSYYPHTWPDAAPHAIARFFRDLP